MGGRATRLRGSEARVHHHLEHLAGAHRRVARGHAVQAHGAVEHLAGLDLAALDLRADEGADLTVYTAAPGSESEEKLRLLASWWASERAENDASPAPGSVLPGAREA